MGCIIFYNTGSRLQRIWLQRIPAYNEQIIVLYGNSCHWTPMLQKFGYNSTVYNELNSVNVTARYKQDPVYYFDFA